VSRTDYFNMFVQKNDAYFSTIFSDPLTRLLEMQKYANAYYDNVYAGLAK
jgi:hypothetical protein